MENAVFICSHIFRNERPVCFVCLVDNQWQMLCGQPDDFTGDDPSKNCRLVGLNHLLDRDPTLLEILDLPVDWQAERKQAGDPWKRSRISGIGN